MSIGFDEEFAILSQQNRLREMSDEKLLQFGRDRTVPVLTGSEPGATVREVFVIQLKEVPLKWPGTPSGTDNLSQPLGNQRSTTSRAASAAQAALF